MVNVVIKEKHDTAVEYPCLMISDMDDIILVRSSFSNSVQQISGTLIRPGKGTYKTVGDYSESWYKDRFVPFTGKIELSNK